MFGFHVSVRQESPLLGNTSTLCSVKKSGVQFSWPSAREEAGGGRLLLEERERNTAHLVAGSHCIGWVRLFSLIFSYIHPNIWIFGYLAACHRHGLLKNLRSVGHLGQNLWSETNFWKFPLVYPFEYYKVLANGNF